MRKIKVNGIYRHSKTGNSYRVLYVGKHSESLEDVVIYGKKVPRFRLVNESKRR